MLSPEILAKIKKIDIQTRKILSGMSIGNYKNISRGSGFEFEQLRDYVEGDDVRFIDWKSSARSGKILVRQYYEDKNRSIYLLVDVSSSINFGQKKEIVRKIASALSLAAYYNKDNVGLILFDNEVRNFISAKCSMAHTQHLMKTVFEYQNFSNGTDIKPAVSLLLNKAKSNSLIFVISDFIGDNFVDALKIISKKHDVVSIKYVENIELNFPDVGILNMQDIETKQENLINSSFGFSASLQEIDIEITKKLKQNYIDLLHLKDNEDTIDKLILFFQKRRIK
ncbi:DUF58 domain-containing protein [Candidatus Dependentiae bacterium]|nr:DUF58 domain-containing protein [Candidatus Dependentiae bacterium]